jgi:hypothetical protein
MSDDEYEVPLQDQRVFGAGIKRQRVRFVPSSSSTPAPNAPPSQSISDFYLSLVLSKKPSPFVTATKTTSQQEASAEESIETAQEPSNSEVCNVCKLPLTSTNSTAIIETEDAATDSRPHEASIAHQVCLTHSHPPSHLDRNRKGLGILSSYGWDPDSRLGLGASGQGIQFPIKVKQKDDKMGIGLVLPKDIDKMKRKKKEKMDAGKVRKMYDEDKRKGERLREMFYRNDDVERYLGGSHG